MRNPIAALRAVRATRGQHPGLLLQRYLSEPATGAGGNREERRALLDAARTAASDPAVQALYRQAFARWEAAFPHAPDGAPPQRFVTLQSSGRLIVGLGAENVLETGLRLQHTYGLPVVPGSALKGLASHYCNRVWGQRHLNDAAPDANQKFRLEGSYHDLLFGYTRADTADAGAIVFHDAWITPDTVPNCLCLDVMTPHHPEWQNGAVPPTDFDSPVPVSFLSVTGAFRVGVSWAGPAGHAQAKNWTELALALLTEALNEWGIGGKTSSGYGRLAPPPPPAAPPPPQPNAKAVVTVLERRDVNNRPAFKVQEAGRPKPGWLQYGTPPAQLPNIGDTITVFWNNTDTNNPQYRWDVPPPAPPARPGNRPRR